MKDHTEALIRNLSSLAKLETRAITSHALAMGTYYRM
jgi:hypothetical protein